MSSPKTTQEEIDQSIQWIVGRLYFMNYDESERQIEILQTNNLPLEMQKEIKNLIASQQQALLDRIEESLPKQVRAYDGNNLESANAYYQMAANSWDEIIRYEDGIRDTVNEVREALKKLRKEIV